MRVTKEKAAQHRAALVASASRLLQERGFDGAGVAEISAHAGLTQGAFYGHFPSKSALAAEACRMSHGNGIAAWRTLKGKTASDVRALIDQYFLPEHLLDAGGGCPMAAYTSEVARQDPIVIDAFVEGFETMVQLMQEALTSDAGEAAGRERALFFISSMAGCVAMARGVAGKNPKMARDIIESARHELSQLATSPPVGNA